MSNLDSCWRVPSQGPKAYSQLLIVRTVAVALEVRQCFGLNPHFALPECHRPFIIYNLYFPNLLIGEVKIVNNNGPVALRKGKMWVQTEQLLSTLELLQHC